jgi:hypothetical protein
VAEATKVGAELKQKVEAEAAAAEAEEPEAEPVEQPEEGADAEEEAEAEEQPAETEAKGRKQADPREVFDRAMASFRKALAKACEVEPGDILPAPHPGVVGFILPGFAEPKTHPDFQACTTCNGRGRILTGAVTGDESKDWHVCPDQRCKGNGFWQRRQEPEQAPTTGPLAVVAQPADTGEWSEAPRWMGDPNLTPQHAQA